MNEYSLAKVQLVINSSTPPTLQINESASDELMNSNVFYLVTSITNIYVPDGAVDTYKATAGYESVVDKIKPLSSMIKVATRQTFDALSDADKVNTLIEEYM